jgi:hypothetical protein
MSHMSYCKREILNEGPRVGSQETAKDFVLTSRVCLCGNVVDIFMV